MPPGSVGVTVRLLGPIDVVDGDGRVHAPASPLRRSLLSLLALRASEVVGSDWLLEHAWVGEPPGSGLRALRFHVSHLRRELPRAELIETRSGGYRLAIAREQVDALAMEDALRLHTGDGAALERALSRWRGAPFLGAAPCAVLDDEAGRLENVRLALEAAWYAARVREGETLGVIPDLLRLVDEQPLAESLWASLITAQYRAGAQADALRSYERLRVTLSETAGLDPSPELQALQAQVLEHDQALGSGRTTRSPRSNVPRPLTPFVGRTDEIDRLRDAIRSETLVSVVGPGGVGKTRLAIEAVRNLDGDGAGGTADHVVFVDLSARAAIPDEVARSIASALEIALGEDAPALARVVDVVQSEPLVLLLDNCEHLVEDVASVVHTLLERCPLVRIVCTSREPIDLPGEFVCRLDVLSEEDAVALFVERARRVDASFSADVSDVASLCRRLERLALAIELAAARVRTFSLADLERRLGDHLDLLSGQRGVPARHRTVDAAIDWSVALLSTVEGQLFSELAVFRAGFDLDAAEAVASEPRRTAVLLDALVNKSLVSITRDGGRRYRYLDLVRRRAVVTDDVRRRHVEHVIDWTRRMRREVEGPSPRAAVEELVEREPDVRAARDSTFDLDLPERRVALVAAIGPMMFSNVGIVPESEEWATEAFATGAGADADRVVLRAQLAASSANVARSAEIAHEVLAAPDGDPGARALAWFQIAFEQVERGRHADAVATFEVALAETEAASDAYWTAGLIGGLANVYRRVGDVDAAQRALDRLVARFGDRLGHQAGGMHWMRGQIALHRGQLDRAARGFDQALASAETTGSWAARCEGHGGLAEIAAASGHWAEAIESFHRAHEARLRTAQADEPFELLGWSHAEAVLGNVHRARELLARARSDALDSLRVRTYTAFAEAEIALRSGDLASAQRAFDSVVVDGDTLGWWFGVVHAETSLATIADAAGAPEVAARHRARARAADPRTPPSD